MCIVIPIIPKLKAKVQFVINGVEALSLGPSILVDLTRDKAGRLFRDRLLLGMYTIPSVIGK